MAGENPSAECELVGEGRADIAGVGIIVGFVGQALLSLLLAGWVFFLSKHGNLDLHHEENTIEHKIDRKRLDIVSDILMIGNDIQMALGMSYMITIFTSADFLDLYHLHLGFDIVSFVGVSNAAAMVCWTFCAQKLQRYGSQNFRKTPEKRTYFTPRHRITYSFAIMFLILAILVCVRLDEWAPDKEPGRCYHSDNVTLSSASHPTADKVYVAVTAAYLLVVMAGAMFLGAGKRRWVLISAFLQFPVHLYMTLALRHANQGRLEGEETDEDSWDFGQTTAIVLLVAAILELAGKGFKYFQFERDLRKNGLPREDTDELKAPSTQGDYQALGGSYELRNEDEQRRLAGYSHGPEP